MQVIDLDGGDLGLSEDTYELIELPLVIKIISRILLDIRKLIMIDNTHALSHAIKISKDNNSSLVENIIRSVKLPQGIEFYDCDGRILFDIRGSSGGVVSNKIFYLMVR